MSSPLGIFLQLPCQLSLAPYMLNALQLKENQGFPGVPKTGLFPLAEGLQAEAWGVLMNAIDLLKNDHQTVRHLFAEYIATDETETDRREDLFQQIEKELLAHTDVEEAIFYPAIKNVAPDLVEQAITEHQEVTQLLTEMLEYEVDDEEFDKRMNSLMETVQTHVQQEEGAGGVMEIARQRLSGQLEEMGRQIQQRKDSADDEVAA